MKTTKTNNLITPNFEEENDAQDLNKLDQYSAFVKVELEFLIISVSKQDKTYIGNYKLEQLKTHTLFKKLNNLEDVLEEVNEMISANLVSYYEKEQILIMGFRQAYKTAELELAFIVESNKEEKTNATILEQDVKLLKEKNLELEKNITEILLKYSKLEARLIKLEKRDMKRSMDSIKSSEFKNKKLKSPFKNNESPKKIIAELDNDNMSNKSDAEQESKTNYYLIYYNFFDNYYYYFPDFHIFY